MSHVLLSTIAATRGRIPFTTILTILPDVLAIAHLETAIAGDLLLSAMEQRNWEAEVAAGRDLYRTAQRRLRVTLRCEQTLTLNHELVLDQKTKAVIERDFNAVLAAHAPEGVTRLPLSIIWP